ncbi:MAG: hypothetical protein AABY04_03340, partial [Candidatus Micrarchaeota archaeon]
NLSIYADIQNTLLLPTGANYPRNTNVTLRANVTDECLIPLTDAQVNLTYKQGQSGFSCAPVMNETNGAYNCSFNTSALPARYYNVTTNSSKPFHNFNSTTSLNIFRIQTGPTLNVQFLNTSNEDGNTSDVGGWKETFNFNVSVTDEDSDQVTAYLFIRQGYSGDWNLVSTRTCNNCNSSILTIPKSNFACGDISGWQFFWNATDGNFSGNLSPTNFTIERDDVNLTYISGNGETIWRNGSASTTLSTLVYDIDAGEIVATGSGSGTRWITVNSSTYDSGAGVTTSSGFFNSTFDTTCTYATGIQSWKMGTTSNSCYKEANSSAFSITLQANLTSALARPLGVNYTRGTSVPVDFNVSDDCQNPVNSTTPVLYFRGSTTYTENSGITALGNGTHTFSWSTTGKDFGFYNVSIQIDKTYYAQANSTKVNSLQLVAGPELQLPTLDKSLGGWGETFAFGVQCRQIDGGIFNVTLWKKLNATDNWAAVETKNCTSLDYTDKTFSETFVCSDISNVGSSYWKFNATNQWGFGAELANSTFTIEKDDTDTTLLAGSGININREGSQTGLLKLNIIDTDRSSVSVGSSVNTSFSVTTNAVNFDSGTFNLTDSSGNTSVYFEPTCTYATGAQKWRGGVTNDTCYKNSFSTNYTLNFTGQLRNNIVNPYFQQQFNTTNQILLRANVTSDCSAENLIANVTPQLQLISPLSIPEICTPINSEAGANAGFYNCTWNSSGKVQGNWSIQFNSSKTGFYNSNSTTFGSQFYLRDVAPIAQNLSVTPGSGGWSRQYNYSVQINDQAGDNVSCTLYVSTDNQSTWQNKGTSSVVGSGNCTVSVQNLACGEIGTDNWYKFYILNGEITNAFNTSSAYGPNLSTTNITISHIYGNETSVNRSFSTSAYLEVIVYDLENQSYVHNSNVTFWVTTNAAAFDAGNQTQSNSSGRVSIRFNPSCSYGVEKQTWKAGTTDVCYTQTNSSNFNITTIGDLNLTFLSPINSQRFVINSNITMRANFTDDCSIPVTGITVLFNASRQSSSTICSTISDEGAGVYNCTYNTSAKPYGIYNITTNGTKINYNFKMNATISNFIISSNPTLTVANVTPSIGGWGENFTFSVRVDEPDGDSVTVKLWEAKIGSAEVNLYTVAVNGSNSSVTFNYSHDTSTAKGNRTFKWNATNNDAPQQTNYTNYTVERNDVALELIFGRNVSIYRYGTESTAFTVRARDTDSQGIVYLGLGFSGMINATTNGTSYVQYDLFSDSSGYLNKTEYDPDCSVNPGMQKWFAFLAQSTDYKSANTTLYDFNVTADLNATLVAPTTGQKYFRGQNITLRARLEDECTNLINSSTFTMSAKLSSGGSTYACLPVNGETGPNNGFYNCTIPDVDTAGLAIGIYNVTINSTKEFYNNSQRTNYNAFVLTAKPTLTSPSVDFSTEDWGKVYTFSVTANDIEGDNFTVYFWKKLGLTGAYSLYNQSTVAYVNPTAVS